jgi:O-antigen ligase
MLAVCAGGGAACAAALATARPPEEHYGGSLVQNRATGMFGQPNELGSLAAAVAVLALAVLLALPRRHPLRLLAGAAAAVGYLALAASLSRGGWIGAAIGFVVLLALLPPRPRRRVLAGLAAVAGAVLLAAVVLPGVSGRPAGSALSVVGDRAVSLVSGEQNPYDDRPAIYREALRQWARRPQLGSGPGGYPVLARSGSGQLGLTGPEHAHSLALTIGAEQGLLGLAALGLAAGVGVVGAIRAARRFSHDDGGGAGEQVLLAGAAAVLSTVLGQGLVDFPLRNPVVESVTWLAVGLLAAACRLPVRVDGAGRVSTGAPVLSPAAERVVVPAVVPSPTVEPAAEPVPVVVSAVPVPVPVRVVPVVLALFTLVSAAMAGLGVRSRWSRP